MAEDTQAEEIAKYKRVLALARSSLEANQATIAVKDQQIAQLIKALEEEKSNSKAKKVLGREEEAALTPRNILCRVDVEDTIWILIEYDDFDDTWKSMDSEQDLEDFIQRIPGVPLSCPTRCLSSEESNRIVRAFILPHTLSQTQTSPTLTPSRRWTNPRSVSNGLSRSFGDSRCARRSPRNRRTPKQDRPC